MSLAGVSLEAYGKELVACRICGRGFIKGIRSARWWCCSECRKAGDPSAAVVVEKRPYKDRARGDALATAIRDLVAHHAPGSTWEGSPTQLLRALNRFTPASHKRRKGWPKNAIGLGLGLSRCTPKLTAMGVIIERRPARSGMHVDLQLVSR